MRKLLIAILFFHTGFTAQSQNLRVEGIAPDLYITHTVAPKENFYSVGRLYNQSPKSIAALNDITLEKGLTIGQQVKIPLNAQNFDVSENSDAGESHIPLTHIVAKSETLFKIGSNFQVAAQSIRKWNNLSSDNIAPGTALIIGYLKTNNALSPASVKSNTPSANNTETDQKIDESSAAGSTAVSKENQPNSKAEVRNDESTNAPDKTSGTSAPVVGNDTALAVIPEDTKQTDKTAAEPVKEESIKPQEKTSVKNEGSETTNQRTDNSSAVTFADLYTNQASRKSEKTKSGDGATFKSTSGWQDKKYYVLINDVAAGTILKISASGNKVVYAKVLGSMPEMKENNGLLLRISNAAASDLGIADPKFSVQISYYQ